MNASLSAVRHRGAGRTLLLILLLAVVWFGPLGYRALIKSDEGRYAEIAREMLVSGDWVTPRMNDLKYFYKPPMQYWATAAAYGVLGESEFAARLWPALTGFLTVLFAGFTAVDHFRLLRTAGKAGDLKMWLRGLNELWGVPGRFRKMIPAYLDFYRRDFHPGQHDASEQLARVKARYLGDKA